MFRLKLKPTRDKNGLYGKLPPYIVADFDRETAAITLTINKKHYRWKLLTYRIRFMLLLKRLRIVKHIYVEDIVHIIASE